MRPHDRPTDPSPARRHALTRSRSSCPSLGSRAEPAGTLRRGAQLRRHVPGRRSLAEAAEYRAAQVDALSRPTATLVGRRPTRAGARTVPTSGTGDQRNTWRQRRAEWRATRSTTVPTSARSSRRSKADEVGDGRPGNAEQDLIVRLAQAYFDVLTAQDALTDDASQQEGHHRAARFGEAQFRGRHRHHHRHARSAGPFDLRSAQEIAAENDLRTKRLALDQLVGRSGVAPKGVALPVRCPPRCAPMPDDWVSRGRRGAPAGAQGPPRARRRQLETEKARAANCPRSTWWRRWPPTTGPARRSPSAASRPSRAASVGLQFNCRSTPAVQRRTASRKRCRWRRSRATTWKAPDAAWRRIRAWPTTACSPAGAGDGARGRRVVDQARARGHAARLQGRRARQPRRAERADRRSSTQRDLAKARYDVLVGFLAAPGRGSAVGRPTCGPGSNRALSGCPSEAHTLARVRAAHPGGGARSSAAIGQRALRSLNRIMATSRRHALAAPRCAAQSPRALDPPRPGSPRQFHGVRTPSSMPATRRAAPAASAPSAACGEVEGVRPHHQRAAAGRGLDQVLPAQRREAAAEQGHVRQRVVQRHLAERVAQPDIRGAGVGAAARRPSALRRRPCRPAAATIAPTSSKRCGWRGTSSSSGRGPRSARQACEQRLLLAFARARGQHHRPRQRLPPLPAARQHARRWRHVELEVAHHLHARRTRLAQPARVVFGLRQHAREVRHRRAHQRSRSARPWRGCAPTAVHWPAPAARRPRAPRAAGWARPRFP